MRLVLYIGAALCATGLAAVVEASTGGYGEGSKVKQFSLPDQHDSVHTVVPAQTRVLLIASDMTGYDSLKAAFAGLDAAYLSKKRAVVMADISGMPGLIASMFAKPKMRKLSWRLLLDDEPEVVPQFPTEPKKVTLIVLDKGVITSVRMIQSSVEIQRAID